MTTPTDANVPAPAQTSLVPSGPEKKKKPFKKFLVKIDKTKLPKPKKLSKTSTTSSTKIYHTQHKYLEDNIIANGIFDGPQLNNNLYVFIILLNLI